MFPRLLWAACALLASAALVWGGLAAPPLPGRREEGAPAGRVPPPPHVEAAAALVLDVDSGRILLAKRAYERLPPGELSKVLVALVALEGGMLGESARIGAEAAGAFGWGMSLSEGELVPVSDLAAVMMYRPGAAAALAIAEHVAGSADAFARRMSAEARRLGAESSDFAAPFDFDAAANRSTAYDLALIASAALRHEAFRDLVRRSRSAPLWNGRSLINVNSLLLLDQGFTGIKTSYTPASGYSALAAADRGGRRLLAVALGSPTAKARRMDVQSLIDYAALHFDLLSASPAIEREAYRVREGDTLSGLAERFGVPISAIRSFNGLSDPDALRAGETLWIPK